jgi:hypothetical protein
MGNWKRTGSAFNDDNGGSGGGGGSGVKREVKAPQALPETPRGPTQLEHWAASLMEQTDVEEHGGGGTAPPPWLVTHNTVSAMDTDAE